MIKTLSEPLRPWLKITVAIVMVATTSLAYAETLLKKSVNGRTVTRTVPDQLVELRASGKVNKRYVPPSKWESRHRDASDFKVTYTGFTDEQKAAYEYAVGIWGACLSSGETITIDAEWANLGEGVLASGGASGWVAYLGDNLPVEEEAFYPAALINCLTDQDHFPGSSDLRTYFNSAYADYFYYGTDGNCPADKLDFVTVVLHEICHGVGFAGRLYYDPADGMGHYDGEDFFGPIPGIFDLYIENAEGQYITEKYSEASVGLGTEITTPGNVSFSGPKMDAALLYTPSTWQQGSSLYHVAEKYNANKNALMTYSLDLGEALHCLGSIVPSVMKDIGWPRVVQGPTIATNISGDVIDLKVEVGDEAPDQEFNIWNGGDEGEIDFTISIDKSWLTCTKTGGSSTGGGDVVTSTLSFNTSGMPVETEDVATITLNDPDAVNNKKVITVNLTVTPPVPEISTDVTDDEINIVSATGVDPNDFSFYVWNTGSGTLDFSVTTDVSWLSFEPSTGQSTGKSDKVPVAIQFDTASFENGAEQTATITVSDANANNSPKTITLNLTVRTMPYVVLECSSPYWSYDSIVGAYSLDIPKEFGVNPDPVTIQVSNGNNESILNFYVSKNSSWVNITPEQGSSVNPDDPCATKVTFSATSLPLGQHQTTLRLGCDSALNTPLDINVNVTVGSEDVPTDDLSVGLAGADSQAVTKSENGSVNYWTDASGNGNDAWQRSERKAPKALKFITGESSLSFDGRSFLVFDDSTSINSGGPYYQKSMIVAFYVGKDVTSRQVLFEQGDNKRGLNILINQSQLLMNAWNLTNHDDTLTPWGPVTLAANLSQYSFNVLVFNFDATDETGKSIVGYLNGVKVGEKSGVGPLYGGKQPAAIGNTVGSTYVPDRDKISGFKGQICEFYYYDDKIISKSEVTEVSAHLQSKYENTFTTINDFALWLEAASGINLAEHSLVESWLDNSTNHILIAQNASKRRPTWDDDLPLGGGQSGAAVSFAGDYKLLNVPNDDAINAAKAGYARKNIFVAFKTGDDVASPQTIWAQGDKRTGLSILVSGGQLVMSAWNLKKNRTAPQWGPVSLSGSIAANTLYQAHLQFDQTQNLFDGSMRKITGSEEYVQLGPAKAPVGILPKHRPAVMGGLTSKIATANGHDLKNAFFGGDVMEVIIYNQTMTESQILKVNSYINSRYNP